METFIDIARMLAARQVSFKRGHITLLEQRGIISAASWVVELEKDLIKAGLDNLFYYSSKNSLTKVFEEAHDKYGLKGEPLVGWAAKLTTLCGWGDARNVTMDKEKMTIHSRVYNSAESNGYGKVGRPVCQFIRAGTAANGAVCFGKSIDGIELHCASEGYPYCEFIAAPTKSFDKKDKRVREQLSLPKKFKSELLK